ncbi:MAG: hypothetical protein COY42_05620 [Armatimonadetes bacterium CG_4_10_14_0_8_um_filter_66_14]|nr:MAG: hypothetical protein COS65_07480 [Armatimonadetes bacterium CG06_land_8_20_14_3_00_66_21]PIX49655.1 MAG: hypothetical protein COZ57_02825 [Armatimonadetes bacterium CG_4_8_14_3_um_filter_66_20]PIY49055.1 MAG: hypothetical protein COZ05_01425 [Armatimonadetes bacterium CG_4_10_14_3_um_filter_59_10]PIZ48799.1 MAG: hypothetical protein COY42_05620 [Armatimonadetes bacterium CG_4_10_14_0_8_um_filter_66_14]
MGLTTQTTTDTTRELGQGAGQTRRTHAVRGRTDAVRPQCAAVTKSGARCRRPALREGDYCRLHANDPEVAALRDEGRRRGGAAAAEAWTGRQKVQASLAGIRLGEGEGLDPEAAERHLRGVLNAYCDSLSDLDDKAVRAITAAHEQLRRLSEQANKLLRDQVLRAAWDCVDLRQLRDELDGEIRELMGRRRELGG